MDLKIGRTMVARILLTLVWLGGRLSAAFLPIVPAVHADTLPAVTAAASSQSLPLLLSLAADQTVMGIRAAEEDILLFDGESWQLIFDGSDVGAGRTDLVAFSMLDSDSLLLAFNTKVQLDGIIVTPQDIVRFDAASLGDTTSGTFSLYFDGSDVGLTSKAERLDALALLPDGDLLISTVGNPIVKGVTAADEDVLAFTPASLGDDTLGTWSLYFDGSDVGLGNKPEEDVDALDVSPEGVIYLSTLGSFRVKGLRGTDEDVFACKPLSIGNTTACEYSPALHFDGSAWRLARNNVDAFHYLPETVPSTPVPSPTRTPISNPTYISLPANLDHESGDFSHYMDVDADGGDLSITQQAALGGTRYGLQVQVDDSHRAFAYAALETPSTTGLVRVRFYIDPNGLLMDHLAQVNVLHLLNSSGTGNFASLKLMRINGRYFLRGIMIDDNGVHRETEVWPISDEPHSVEIKVRRASSAASNDASYETWIDGARKKTMTGVDSYEKFESFQYLSVGLNGIAGNVRGVYYLDELVVNEDGREIGPHATTMSVNLTTPQPANTPLPPVTTP